MIPWDAFAVSEQGRSPDGNEDYAVVAPEDGVFIVADGMGGRPGGDRASRVGAEAFLDQVRRLAPDERLDDRCLRGALSEANDAVRALARGDPTLTGLGTTLSAIVWAGGEGRIVHVGDSRVYRCRQGNLEQLTADHTLVAELVARHHLSTEAARRYPLKNVLSRSLGPRGSVQPDIAPLVLAPGDWLLLATDGLAQAMPARRLASVIGEAGTDGAEVLCRAVMAAALDGPTEDNITVLAARLRAPEPEGAREAWSAVRRGEAATEGASHSKRLEAAQNDGA